ncbi:MAG: hypothetical protein Q7S22_02700, partial [Candidatus Micrarchaeota archaeon]|nr:hypothetical protein [Candidatus Micrarchaeota archaeon]
VKVLTNQEPIISSNSSVQNNTTNNSSDQTIIIRKKVDVFVKNSGYKISSDPTDFSGKPIFALLHLTVGTYLSFEWNASNSYGYPIQGSNNCHTGVKINGVRVIDFYVQLNTGVTISFSSLDKGYVYQVTPELKDFSFYVECPNDEDVNYANNIKLYDNLYAYSYPEFPRIKSVSDDKGSFSDNTVSRICNLALNNNYISNGETKTISNGENISISVNLDSGGKNITGRMYYYWGNKNYMDYGDICTFNEIPTCIFQVPAHLSDRLSEGDLYVYISIAELDGNYGYNVGYPYCITTNTAAGMSSVKVVSSEDHYGFDFLRADDIILLRYKVS